MLRQAALLLWKDLVVELRARELVYATVFFAAVVLMVFAFAFFGGERPTVDVTVGVMWVAVTLAGTLGIGRVFEREREGDTFRALLLSPVPRSAIYLAKLCSIALLMLLLELVVVVLASVLFGASLMQSPARLAVLLFLGTVGFSAIAGLFGASLARARSREVLLPLLVYPLVVPVLIAGTRGTAALVLGDGFVGADYWIKFLIVFDAIFLTIGFWVFDSLVGEE